ncbi:MAG: cupredoxin domain-containing protein [Candidatus Daviesbacteria bacterium]|nr:MAG: cupredoxin domain-containing protein [Candidatus Daviesbacteria bacterium]
MNINKGILIAIAILVLAGGYIFYQGTQNQGSPAPAVTDSSPTASPAESTGSGATAAVKEFNVTGSSFKFDPATITVSQGDTVKINFRNTAGTHDFSLDDFNVKTKVLKADETETVEFVADKAGTFEYFCSVGNHRSLGMVGKLVVE